MATYYKYVERTADSEVNWAEIGKNLTDMLSAQNKLREDKKAAIDDATRSYGEQLSNAPTGEHTGANEWTLKAANDLQEARLLQDRLLKSGKLKLKDYTVMRQNLLDGTKNLFDLSKEFQAQYKDKLDRMNAADPSQRSQMLEVFTMEQANSFANLTNTGMYINPTNYAMSVGKKVRKEVNGQQVDAMSDNPDDFITINELRNRITSKFNYYDVNKNINAFVDSQGKLIDSIKTYGKITEVLDPTKRKMLSADGKSVVNAWDKAEDGIINSFFANPYNLTSVLTNDMKMIDGKVINFTQDRTKADADPSLILLKVDPATQLPTIDETGKHYQEQFSQAKDWVRAQIRTRIDQETKVSAVSERAPTEAELGIEQARKEAENFGKNLGWLVSGNLAEQQQKASEYFRSMKGVQKVDRTDDGIDVYMTNGQKLHHSFTGANKESSVRSLVKALNIEGTYPEDVVIKFAMKTGTGNVTKGTAFAERTDVESEGVTKGDYQGAYVNYVESSVPKDLFEYKQDAVTDKLKESLSSIGFDVAPTGSGPNNYVKVTQRGTGKAIEIPTNAWSSGGAIKERNKLIEFLNTQLTPGQKQKLYESGTFGSTTTSKSTPNQGDLSKRISGY